MFFHPTVDQEAMHNQYIALTQRLVNMEDQCNRLSDLCHQKHAMMQRLSAFLYENGLRLFVPVAHTFNSRSYADYEREYMSWYNMIDTKSSL